MTRDKDEKHRDDGLRREAEDAKAVEELAKALREWREKVSARRALSEQILFDTIIGAMTTKRPLGREEVKNYDQRQKR